MKVEVVRRGGIAGIALRATVDTASLPARVSVRVEAAVRGLPFGRPPSPPRHPDSFQYAFTLVDGDAAQTAVLDEAELPTALRPLIAAALKQASSG